MNIIIKKYIYSDYLYKDIIISEEMNMITNIIKQNITNRLTDMIFSGSKGNLDNIFQIVIMLSQQYINNDEMLYEYSNLRTLPIYKKDDVKNFRVLLTSKGYIKNSFSTGLNVDEFFYHAITGRVGLINTAVKTGDIGYFNRKLLINLENIMICENYLIKEINSGKIISFKFSENNFNYKYLQDIYLDVNKYSRNNKLIKDLNIVHSSLYMKYFNNNEKKIYI